ncbi:phenoloxidase-activating factor 1-like [Macrosteles quadrilineatus]|uniref:phenoloxidase-activating factor 1-like n=1 Tax=Macrosteles quadrilineatus TaxID=74068 RepID=UPI0023E1C5BE|nr:phenoloxidase-activating factor 1-like [Macrosteles quadrilineatus]
MRIVAAILVLVAVSPGWGQRVELKEGDACKRVSGVEWTCRKSSDCPKAAELMRRGKAPEVCRTSGGVTIVCCEPPEEFEDKLGNQDEQPDGIEPGIKYQIDEGLICKRVEGKPWVCTKLRRCPSARALISKGKEPEYCRPSGKDKVVCCDQGFGLVTEPSFPVPDDTSPPPKPATPVPKPSPGFKSRQMCQRYSTIVNEDQCTSTEPQIVNGAKARPKEFPHMALLGSGMKTNPNCGGSLISDRWILSAAHCTTGDADNAGPVWARLGDYDFSSTDDEDRLDARSVVYNIIERVNHPEYEPRDRKYYNDIALYKLDRPVEFDQYIRPICLHTGGEYELTRKRLLIAGWGKDDHDGFLSSTLLKGNVSFVHGSECVRRYRVANRTVDTKTTICTNSSNGTTVCSGDSGGPLQYRLDRCMYSQVGVTSLGANFCTVDRYPAIYTRVSHYIDWIESVVWP